MIKKQFFLKIFALVLTMSILINLVPISSFGHSLTHAAVEGAMENGYFGLLLGIFDLTSSGIVAAILFAFVMAVLFKPKG